MGGQYHPLSESTREPDQVRTHLHAEVLRGGREGGQFAFNRYMDTQHLFKNNFQKLTNHHRDPFMRERVFTDHGRKTKKDTVTE